MAMIITSISNITAIYTLKNNFLSLKNLGQGHFCAVPALSVYMVIFKCPQT